MNKHIIIVPRGIRYISNWEEFNSIFPQHQHILDKSITGCGFTEWCLTNPMNVVLCSPRNILLDNKAEQHPGEVYRIRSPYFDKELGVDKDTSGKIEPGNRPIQLDDTSSKSRESLKREKEEELEKETRDAYERISKGLDEYIQSRNILPRKILVTYDSFHTLKDVLRDRGILDSFYIIVDEFQSIFVDARFKSDVEMNFVHYLQDLPRVCYLSATPMLDRYLEDIPEFRDMPFYKLDWEMDDPSRVMKPNLLVKVVRNIFEPAHDIIESYKSGQFQRRFLNDNNLDFVESREAVIYVNSVQNIIQIIDKNDLRPEEVNILCANTVENQNRIRNKLGRGWSIGKVPLEGQPRKMFTFCTRTVYLGADFYSNNARTFVLSDANIECLAVDISLDLPQIMGRQRLWENPWKNDAEFYYKALTDKNVTDQEEFDAKIQKKLEVSNEKLVNFENAVYKDTAMYDLKRIAELDNYKNDYIGINVRTNQPAINNLVLIAEKRAFDIQQLDYKDRFSVLNSVNLEVNSLNGEITAFFLGYDEIKSKGERLRFLCEAELSEKAREAVEIMIDGETKSFLALGKDRIKALGYNTTKIKNELGVKTFSIEILLEEVYKEFEEGNKLSRVSIKKRLAKIYERIGYNKAAKASDIEEWFEIKKVHFQEGGKPIHGFELLNRKR